MKQALISALIYLIIGVVCMLFAIRQVHIGGWGIFTYILLIIATIDIGASIRILNYIYRVKNKQK